MNITDGPRLAHGLSIVIDRHIWIDFAEMKIQTRILYELFIVRRQESSIEELRKLILDLQPDSESEDDETE